MPFSITGVATGVNGTSADVTVSTLPANSGAQLIGTSSLGTYVARATLPTAATGTLVVNDPYVPFGVAVTYKVTAYTPGAVTVTAGSPFTLAYAAALLTDTATGTSVQVQVAKQDSRRYEARSVFYDVIGRQAPVVATHPARPMGASLRFRCATLADREAVSAFLRAGYPLVLRTPWHGAVDDVAFLAASWEDTAVDPSVGPYYLDVAYQAVDVSGVPFNAPPLTYAGLAAAVTTYANITTLFPTYLKLAGVA